MKRNYKTRWELTDEEDKTLVLESMQTIQK